MSILAVQPSLAAPAPEAPAPETAAARPTVTRFAPMPPLAEVIGADLTVPLVHGGVTRYVNLDYAATAPALRAVAEHVAELLPLYASVHRGAGFASQVSTAPARTPGPTWAASSARARTTWSSSPATPPTRSTCWRTPCRRRRPRLLYLDIEHHANLLPWQRRGRGGAGGATPARDARRRRGRAGRDARRAARGHRRLERHRPVPADRRAGRDRAPARRPDRGGRGAARAAPARLAARVRGRLPGAVRAQALRPVRRRRAGRAAGLAGRGAAVPGRRRRGARGRLGGTDWAAAPARHEAGTPNVLGAAALAAACAAAALGPDAVSAHEDALAGAAAPAGSP